MKVGDIVLYHPADHEPHPNGDAPTPAIVLQKWEDEYKDAPEGACPCGFNLRVFIDGGSDWSRQSVRAFKDGNGSAWVEPNVGQ